MDLRQYSQALKKFWWAIAIPVVVLGVLGTLRTLRTDPIYRGSVTFFVRTTGDVNTNSQFAGDQFAQRRVNSYVALLGTDRMAQMILDATDLDLSLGQISHMIGATGDVNTVLLTATVTSGSEELTDTVTKATSTEFVKLVDQVENSAVGESAVNVEVVSGPHTSKVTPNKYNNTVVFATIGLLIGLGLALILELSDTAVRSDEQAIALSAGPVLGRIPMDKTADNAPLITEQEKFSIRAEAFRQLRTNLQFINVDRAVQVLAITSSIPADGKTSVSANLALTVAAAGQRVLAIEADLRRPKLASLFGLERSVGLTDVLTGNVDVDDVLQPWGRTGLTVLPGGEIPPNPSELLGSDAMLSLLTRLRSRFDLIILDLPPLLPVTDAAVAATRADGALLVIRYGKTTRQQVAASIEALSVVGAPILGSAFTRTPTKSSRYVTYEYSYAPERPLDRRPNRSLVGSWRRTRPTRLEGQSSLSS